MIIGIDIDGVIADFVGTFLPILNTICSCTFNEIVSHNFLNNVKVDEDLYNRLWQEQVDSARVYENLEPVARVHDSMKKIAKNHQIILISSRKENSRKVTESWLRKNKIPFSRLEFTKNKREKVELMSSCDLIIEDELDIARMVESKGVHVILFDYPWTKIGSKIKKVKNWNKAIEEIEAIYKLD